MIRPYSQDLHTAWWRMVDLINTTGPSVALVLDGTCPREPWVRLDVTSVVLL